MIWQNAAAAWALLALAVPVLIHLLVLRRSKPTPFPTLRFIPTTRLASIERRTLEDAALLALRLGVLAAAAAAAAQPFAATSARRRAWDADIVRAEVVSGAAARSDAERSFTADSIASGLGEALVWLESQRPGRRELILRSPFPIGTVTSADVAGVPANIGLRFERTGALPQTRTLAAPPVTSRTGDGRLVQIGREISLDADRTLVRDLAPSSTGRVPVEVAAPEARRVAAEAVLNQVVSARVPVPVADRAVRLELIDGAGLRGRIADGIHTPWIAEAAARIWRATSSESTLSDLRFSESSGRLVVTASSAVTDSALSGLIRSAFDAIGPGPAQPAADVVAISDAQLAAWSRPPGPADPPAPSRRPWDGRWFWMLSLVLLAVEVWIRRGPRVAATAAPEDHRRVA